MDSLPPPPAPQPYVYAASDSRPRQTREIELCERASTTDWVYLSGLGAGLVATIALDTTVFRQIGSFREIRGELPGDRLVREKEWRAWKEGDLSSPAGRTFGAGLVGLSVGTLVGGMYLALPKCDRSFAYGPPPEGSSRSTWPVALTLALASAALGPIIVAIETGAPYGRVVEWEVSERAVHFIVPAFTGFAGAFLPYLFPPKTWRAAREIERIRAGVGANGAYVGYTFRF